MSEFGSTNCITINNDNAIYRIYPDSKNLAAAAAGFLQDIITKSIQDKGCCYLALSGGSTPKLMFEALSRADNIPWELVTIFWSDERYVPHTHVSSNYRMACEALLDKLPAKPKVFPVNTELHSPKLAADHYEATMREVFKLSKTEAWPCFDCILLGMGADGHTASLFPGEKVLKEQKAWADVAQAPDKSYRITLTLPVINAARKVAFLVSGQEKSSTFAAIARKESLLPAAMVTAKEITWLLDAAAAKLFR